MKNLKKNINFYNDNGYLKIKSFFSKNEVNNLKRLINEIEKLKPKKGKHMIYKDLLNKKEILTRTENFYDYHKGIKKFLSKKKIYHLLKKITGHESILFKDKINWKYPGAEGFEPHQDAQVWEPLYKKVKSFFSLTISIDKTTKKNGCLEIAAKHHKKGLLGDNKSAIPKKIVNKLKWKKIYTRPGDIIIFDAYTPHRSNKNYTKKPRRMMYLTYNAKKDGDFRKEYFEDKRRSFPPNNERLKNKKYKYLI